MPHNSGLRQVPNLKEQNEWEIIYYWENPNGRWKATNLDLLLFVNLINTNVEKLRENEKFICRKKESNKKVHWLTTLIQNNVEMLNLTDQQIWHDSSALV